MKLTIDLRAFRFAIIVCLLLLGSGCSSKNSNSASSTSNSGSPPVITEQPVLVHNPNSLAPLTGILTLKTDQPTRVVLDVTDGTDTWQIKLKDYETDHSHEVVGFRADATTQVKNTVTVTVVNQDGQQTQADNPLTFVSPVLPADFTQMRLLVDKPNKMEPGFTVICPSVYVNWSNPPATIPYAYAVALDSKGKVVWYYRSPKYPGTMDDMKMLANGDISYIDDLSDWKVITPAGDLVARYYPNGPGTSLATPIGAIGVNLDLVTHDVTQMPSGDFLVLSTEDRDIDNYPTSYTDLSQVSSTPTPVMGTVVAEVRPDGSIVNEWKLLDMLDATRIGYLSLSSESMQNRYPDMPRDWAHANSVIYDAIDDTIVVSLRQQDAVVKFHRDLTNTGIPSDIVWIFGPHNNWGPQWQPYLLTPTNFYGWPYHQHDANIGSDGEIYMFDNGNYRASPPNTALSIGYNYSRGIEFHVDESNMTVTQVWDYGSPNTAPALMYSSYYGSTRQLPITNNVLIDFPTNDYVDGAPSNEGFSRIIEMTRDGEVVFDLQVGNDDTSDGYYLVAYRALRVPGLSK